MQPLTIRQFKHKMHVRVRPSDLSVDADYLAEDEEDRELYADDERSFYREDGSMVPGMLWRSEHDNEWYLLHDDEDNAGNPPEEDWEEMGYALSFQLTWHQRLSDNYRERLDIFPVVLKGSNT